MGIVTLGLYLLAGIDLAIGLMLLTIGRNALPFGRRTWSPLTARLNGAAMGVVGVVLTALATDGQHGESTIALVPIVGAFLYAGLTLAAFLVDRHIGRRGTAS